MRLSRRGFLELELVLKKLLTNDHLQTKDDKTDVEILLLHKDHALKGALMGSNGNLVPKSLLINKSFHSLRRAIINQSINVTLPLAEGVAENPHAFTASLKHG